MRLIQSKRDADRAREWIDGMLAQLAPELDKRHEERHRAKLEGMIDALLTARTTLCGHESEDTTY